MDNFTKICAGVLITLVLCLALSKQDKDITLLIIAAACCMVATAEISFISPVLDFVKELSVIGNLNTSYLKILLKAVGIGILGEITSLICTDAGNNALAKTLQLLTSGVIVWISLPLLSELIELIKGILSTL